MRARWLIAFLVCALVLGVGVRETFSSFSAWSIATPSSSFQAVALGTILSVVPGTDVQPGTSTRVAAGYADALSVNLGTVPATQTFVSVFTVTNTTGVTQPLVLTPTLPAQAATVFFVATGTRTDSLAPGASTAVEIQTTSATAGVGTGTVRLGRSDLAWLYRDYPLNLVQAPQAPTGVTATAAPAGAIAVAWSPTSTTGDLAGYDVYRQAGAGPLTKITTSPQPSTSFNDTQTVAGTAYTYLVRAVAVTPSGLSSLNSPTASATADATSPAVTVARINGAGATFPVVTNVTTTTAGGACESAAGSSLVSWSVAGDASESGTTACTAGAWTQTLTSALAAEGHYTLSATQADAAGNLGSSGGQAVTVDRTKPLIAATALAGVTGYLPGTWANQSITVSFTCADTGAVQSGLVSNTVGGGGTQSAETSTGSFTSTGTCTDAAGNTAVANVFSPIKVDKTKPVLATTAKNADTTTYTAGTWTRQAVTVAFTCAEAGTVQSGLLVNTVAGATQNADTATGSITNSGICTDNAGNSADAATFSPIKVDQTAPSGGSADATGLVGTGSRYAISTALSIALAKGTDTGSGLATGATLWGAQGTLASSDGVADGTCTGFGAYGQAGSSDPATPLAYTAPTDNACYRAQYRVLDAAGNLAVYTSGDIKVETTAPSSLTPAFTFSNVVGTVYPTGTTVYFKDATTGAGNFTITASSTDARSGIAGYAFPAPPTGWTVSGSGASRAYSYSGTSVTAGSVSVTATNNATRTASTTLTFSTDNNIPLVAITAPADGGATLGTPTFSGSCDPLGGTVTVAVTQGATAVESVSDTTCTSSVFSVNASPALTDGSFSAQARQARGGHTGTSVAIAFTVDTIRPALTINQAAGQTDPANAATINFTATFSEPVSGFAAADVTKSSGAVAVTGGPTTYNVAVTGMTNGSALTVSVAANLASDLAGNLNTASTSTDNSVTYDATAPVVTLTKVNGGVVAFPLATTASVTSIGGACGAVTRDIATVSWSVTGGATQSGSAPCTAGAWSATLTTLSAESAYTLSATQTDTAGNTGTTGNQTLTIDRTAPTVTLTTPTNNTSVNTTTPTLAGAAGNATGDSTTITVKLYSGPTTAGALLQTLTPTRTTTTWTTTPTTLTQGTYTAQATQTDTAANTTTTTANTFTVDTTAPTLTLSKLNGTPVTFPANTTLTNITTTGGTCGTATGDTTTINWAVTGGSTQTGTTTCTTGTWTATLTTPLTTENTYTLSATQTDTAGNTGTTGNQTLTIDRTAPTVTLTTPTNNTSVNTTTPTLAGAAGNATGDSTTITVKLYSGPTTAGALLQTLTPTRTTTTWTTTPTTLTQGTYTAQATQTDTAANTTTTTANTFTVDTTAPTLTLSKLNGTPVTFPANTTLTNITTTGGTCGTATGDTTTINWAVTGGSTQTGTTTCTTGTWTATLTTPLTTENTYTLSATQTDTAGNTGTTGNQTLRLDRTAPTLLSAIAANGNGTVGYLGSGTGTPDTLTLTYTDAGGVSPASIVAGWDGTGTRTVSVTFTNAATDSIAIPGMGTVTLGASNWLTSTSTQSETLSMTATNVFVLSFTATPTGSNATAQVASTFIWSAAGGAAADSAGNLASGSGTSAAQRF